MMCSDGWVSRQVSVWPCGVIDDRPSTPRSRSARRDRLAHPACVARGASGSSTERVGLHFRSSSSMVLRSRRSISATDRLIERCRPECRSPDMAHARPRGLTACCPNDVDLRSADDGRCRRRGRGDLTPASPCRPTSGAQCHSLIWTSSGDGEPVPVSTYCLRLSRYVAHFVLQ